MSEYVTYETGGKREVKTGKGRYDLLSPIFLRRLALVMEKGGKMHGDRNWEKGLPLHSYIDSALRHIFQLLAGDTDEDHAAHAAWNLQGFIHTSEMIQEGELPATLNDLPRCYFGPAEEEYTITEKGRRTLKVIEFEEWLEFAPKSISETFDHFRWRGWTDDEIMDTKDALVRAGKVDYDGNRYILSKYKGVDSDVDGEAILPIRPPA